MILFFFYWFPPRFRMQYYTVHLQVSLFADLWRLIKLRALVTVRENFLLFTPKFATFLLFGSRFCFSFNPRTFLFRKTFQVHETISIAIRTTTLECKQKMLISWHRISGIKQLPRKTCRRVHTFWVDLDGLLTLFKKCLVLNNSRAIWDFIFIFSEYVSFINDLSFGQKKNLGGKISPRRHEAFILSYFNFLFVGFIGYQLQQTPFMHCITVY